MSFDTAYQSDALLLSNTFSLDVDATFNKLQRCFFLEIHNRIVKGITSVFIRLLSTILVQSIIELTDRLRMDMVSSQA